MQVQILLAFEQGVLRKRIWNLLSGDEGVLLETVGKRQLWQSLNQGDVDMVMIEEEQLPSRFGKWVTSVRELPEQPEVVVFRDHEEPSRRAALMAAGCLAVLDTTIGDEELGPILQSLIERRRRANIERLEARYAQRKSTLNDFASSNPSMTQFLAIASKVVDSESSLLILGETGVGKERLARAIHSDGPRSAGPFLAVNCGALPETLLESELFGYEQGAFTGATRARRGFFELAHTGTIFLDEIAEVPLHLQVKLLRVLEDRRVQRLGSERSRLINVRVMAATNRNLEEEVKAKRFRIDLYYRLAVVTLEIPPLRERPEDISNIVQTYLEHFSILLRRNVRTISAEALEALIRYPWPGNVRELINVLERGVLLATEPAIQMSDLPRAIVGSVASSDTNAVAASDTPGIAILPDWRGLPLREARNEVVTAFEKAYLNELLRSTRGRIGDAARHAGVDPRSLYELMKRHQLRKENFKASAVGS